MGPLLSQSGWLLSGFSSVVNGYVANRPMAYEGRDSPPPGSNLAQPDFFPIDGKEWDMFWTTWTVMVVVLFIYICCECYVERKEIRRLQYGRFSFFAQLFRRAMLSYAYSFGVLEFAAVIIVGMWKKSSSGMGFLQGAIYCGITLGIGCWIFGKVPDTSGIKPGRHSS
ncbi:hypothetical protein OZX67_00245 [Bifidobacterium sp. ESL0728]|uniref:hypothetical protein n=1 Tax=Bifidobacterium sp. ESL0728 TaxID=2983220 RepID=UPI0023F87E75|nr:hypothetical protein [Bifidobacterium sp. ESL0728]WEV59050.1 hypothetical protein OZX67_00245 [Bifidobacterium sp. ESL0728]